MAEQIAVGQDGRLYVVNNGKIFESQPMTDKLKCKRNPTPDTLARALAKE